MTQIEAYLSDALDYDALTPEERCAICGAKEGIFWQQVDRHTFRSPRFMRHPDRVDDWMTDCFRWTDYLHSATGALRLVERFNLWVEALDGGGYYARGSNMRGHTGDYPTAAIEHCVCELAKAEWPYRDETSKEDY